MNCLRQLKRWDRGFEYLLRYKCLCLFCVCVQVVSLRRADPQCKESCRLCKRWRNWKSGQGPTKGCTAYIDILVHSDSPPFPLWTHRGCLSCISATYYVIWLRLVAKSSASSYRQSRRNNYSCRLSHLHIRFLCAHSSVTRFISFLFKFFDTSGELRLGRRKALIKMKQGHYL
jgi:hypothetical protein